MQAGSDLSGGLGCLDVLKPVENALGKEADGNTKFPGLAMVTTFESGGWLLDFWFYMPENFFGVNNFVAYIFDGEVDAMFGAILDFVEKSAGRDITLSAFVIHTLVELGSKRDCQSEQLIG